MVIDYVVDEGTDDRTVKQELGFDDLVKAVEEDEARYREFWQQVAKLQEKEILKWVSWN